MSQSFPSFFGSFSSGVSPAPAPTKSATTCTHPPCKFHATQGQWCGRHLPLHLKKRCNRVGCAFLSGQKQAYCSKHRHQQSSKAEPAAKKQKLAENKDPKSEKAEEDETEDCGPDVDCAICLDSLTTKVSHVYDCGHAFHNTCIKDWCKISKKHNCPLCRKTLKKNRTWTAPEWHAPGLHATDVVDLTCSSSSSSSSSSTQPQEAPWWQSTMFPPPTDDSQKSMLRRIVEIQGQIKQQESLLHMLVDNYLNATA